jgi:alkylhydroperoxidase family enzyme
MASSALGEALVQAVYDDWRTAPVTDVLRAALGLVNVLTLTPMQVTPQDVNRVRAAGGSDAQIREAIHICGVFNMIVRLADALDFAVPDTSAESGYGVAALARGYEL